MHYPGETTRIDTTRLLIKTARNVFTQSNIYKKKTKLNIKK